MPRTLWPHGWLAVVCSCLLHGQAMAAAVTVPTTDPAGKPLVDAGGQRVPDLPADTHRLRTWHPQMREGTDLQTRTVRVPLPVVGP